MHIRVELLPSFVGFFVGMLKPIEDFHSLGLDHTTDGWLQLTLTLTTLVSRVKGYPAAAYREGEGEGAKQPIFEA